MAPDWPYPLYDAAYTHLLMGESEQAYALYKRVDQMAPRGFYTAKTSLHALQGESKGLFPKGTYLYFLGIEWADDPKEKQQIASQLTAKVPLFAPGWKARAALEQDPEQRLAYLEMGLKANPDPQTRGLLLINKALILDERGKKADAIGILGELALDPASPSDIEAMAKKTLELMAK